MNIVIQCCQKNPRYKNIIATLWRAIKIHWWEMWKDCSESLLSVLSVIDKHGVHGILKLQGILEFSLIYSKISYYGLELLLAQGAHSTTQHHSLVIYNTFHCPGKKKCWNKFTNSPVYVRHDRRLKALRMYLHKVSLYLKKNFHKFRQEDDLFTTLYIVMTIFLGQG